MMNHCFLDPERMGNNSEKLSCRVVWRYQSHDSSWLGNSNGGKALTGIEGEQGLPSLTLRYYCQCLASQLSDHRSVGTAATRSGLISTYFFPAACDRFLRASRIESVAERTAASSRGLPVSCFSCLFPKIAAAIAAFPSLSFS